MAATGALLGMALPASAGAQSAGAQRALQRTLAGDVHRAGGQSGALVLDMNTGRTLFAAAADTPRLPASVEKLYTTSTALLRFGPTARLSTRVLGVGTFDATRGWHGTLFLKGGGDPTFGSQSFDQHAYGGGATMQRLVANLKRQTGITSLTGTIVGDESYFDTLRGTPPYGYHAAADIEGELSALAYDRGLANEQGSAFQRRPALFAAQQFASALRAAGIKVAGSTRVRAGKAPQTATPLSAVQSPSLATLIRLTNTPSDNFFAEMLLKGLGASFGGAGTTAAGAAVVRSQVAQFGIHPRLDDGSGLSRTDGTSPRQMVTLLQKMVSNVPFVNSLAVGGRTGTLQYEMQGTPAQDNCRGKTGTLRDVANLAGYCTGRDGHRLVFAFLFGSQSDPNAGHAIEAQMAVALAKYDG